MVLKDVTAVGILSASPALDGVIEHYAAGSVDPGPLVAATVGLDQVGVLASSPGWSRPRAEDFTSIPGAEHGADTTWWAPAGPRPGSGISTGTAKTCPPAAFVRPSFRSRQFAFPPRGRCRWHTLFPA